MSSTTSPRFPLLPILVACASALAHKQFSTFPEHGHFAVAALIIALGFGTYVCSFWGLERRRFSLHVVIVSRLHLTQTDR